jgi:hypothetical protein
MQFSERFHQDLHTDTPRLDPSRPTSAAARANHSAARSSDLQLGAARVGKRRHLMEENLDDSQEEHGDNDVRILFILCYILLT